MITTPPTLPESLKDHIDDNRVYATVATLGRNGHPHLTVVWLARDGDDLLFSTTVDRQQGKNIAADPRVTVLINPPEQPYLYAEIRGSATLTPDPERVLPDQLSLEYTGKLYAEFNPASVNDGDPGDRAGHPAPGRQPHLTARGAEAPTTRATRPHGR